MALVKVDNILDQEIALVEVVSIPCRNGLVEVESIPDQHTKLLGIPVE